MKAAEGKIAEQAIVMDHARNCAAWKDRNGHDVNGEDCTCGLRFRIEISTLQTLKDAWEKRAYESEERERVLRGALRECRTVLVTDNEYPEDSGSVLAIDAALATPAPEPVTPDEEHAQ